MATIDYSIGVSTSQGIQALQQLQNKVAATSETFNKLKGAVAGLAVGQFLRSLYDYADSIDDIAKANNLAIESVMGFGKALEYNGGKADAAANGLATFTSNIAEAADGSAKLQDTFRRLNVSLTDLGKLSEQELLEKTIEELSKIDNASLRASLSTQLFGKALKGVDMKGMLADYQKYTAEQAKNAPSIAAAARANENLSRVMGTFKTEVLAALEPISELAANLLEIGSTTKAVIRFILDFAIAVASLWAGFKLLKGAWLVITGIGSAFASVGEIAANLMGLLRVMFNPILRADLLTNMKMAGPLLRGIAVVAEAVFGSIKTVVGGFIALGGAIYATWNAIKNTFGWGEKSKEDADKAAKADKKAADAAREVQDAYAKKALEISRVSENFAKANARLVDAVNIENQLIGQSKLFGDTLKAQEELYKRSADEIDKLRDAKEQLSAEEKRAGLGANYDQQIAKIQDLTKAESERIARVIENQNRLQSLEQLRLYGIKNEIEMSNKLQTIQDTMAKSTMSELEKRYYDIEAAAKASAKAAIEAEEARVGRKLNAGEVKAYYDAAVKGSEELKQATDEEYKNSRRFATGWKSAFNDYVENATNAAEQARKVFQTMTQGMEDLLFNFVKTGKFEWSNFVQSMVDTLLRSQIQQLMANVMGGGSTGGTGGGLVGGLGKLLGFASGGIIPTNGPVIVGERGPELLSGASGMRVTPNDQLGGTNVTYNINAVDAMSFKQMIAQDPTFLFAVSEQGRRKLPGAR